MVGKTQCKSTGSRYLKAGPGPDYKSYLKTFPWVMKKKFSTQPKLDLSNSEWHYLPVDREHLLTSSRSYSTAPMPGRAQPQSGVLLPAPWPNTSFWAPLSCLTSAGARCLSNKVLISSPPSLESAWPVLPLRGPGANPHGVCDSGAL